MSVSAVNRTFERPALEVLPVSERPSSAAAPDETSGSRCNADWRRPDRYWVCIRKAGHHGRHKMRASIR